MRGEEEEKNGDDEREGKGGGKSKTGPFPRKVGYRCLEKNAISVQELRIV